MLIHRIRPLCIALLVALPFFAFCAGTSADPRIDAMVERVLSPLNAAMGLLTSPGELTPDDRHHAVDAILAAINTLNEYQRQSH
jgi:hypothetical protein